MTPNANYDQPPNGIDSDGWDDLDIVGRIGVTAIDKALAVGGCDEILDIEAACLFYTTLFINGLSPSQPLILSLDYTPIESSLIKHLLSVAPVESKDDWFGYLKTLDPINLLAYIDGGRLIAARINKEKDRIMAMMEMNESPTLKGLN